MVDRQGVIGSDRQSSCSCAVSFPPKTCLAALTGRMLSSCARDIRVSWSVLMLRMDWGGFICATARSPVEGLHPSSERLRLMRLYELSLGSLLCIRIVPVRNVWSVDKMSAFAVPVL